MSEQTPMVVNRYHVPGCKCDTANDDPALNVADPTCEEWTKIQERYLAERDARIRADIAAEVLAPIDRYARNQAILSSRHSHHADRLSTAKADE